MKLRDLAISKGDRTDFWAERALKGESPIMLILNRTEAMMELELREKIKLMIKAYEEGDYARKCLSSFTRTGI